MWFLAPFAVFGLLGMLWALASPVFSVPDENAHATKAIAQLRGQVIGYTLPGVKHLVVDLPPGYEYTPDMLCFATHSEVPASCAVELGDPGGQDWFNTWVGAYNPVYYYLVGWPSLLFDGNAGVYAMRIASSLLGAALLAWAFLAAASGTRSRWMPLGIAFAAAPDEHVPDRRGQPERRGARGSGRGLGRRPALLETFGVPRRSDRGSRGPRSGRASRSRPSCSSMPARSARCGSSIIVALCFLASGWPPVKAPVHDRGELLVAREPSRSAGVFSAGLDAVGRQPLEPGRGVRRAPRRRHVPAGVPPHDPDDARLCTAGDRVLRLDRRAAARVGVLAASSPRSRSWSCSRFTAHPGAQRAGAVRDRDRRAVLVPALVQGYSVHQTGIIWQGRYGLFLYLGITIVAAWLLVGMRPADRTTSPRASPGWPPPSSRAFGVIAFFLVLVRYVIGGEAPLGEMLSAPQWQPPLGWPRSRSATLIVSLALVALVGLAATLDRPPGARRRIVRGRPRRRRRASAGTWTEPRVAIAYDCLFPIDTGGGERVYRRMAELFVERGSAVDYVTRSGRDAGAGAGIRRRRRLERRDHRRRRHPHARRAPSRSPLALFRHFARHRGDYDLVIVAALPGAQRLRGARSPSSAPAPSSRRTGSRSGRGASGAPTRAPSSAPSRSCCSRSACTSAGIQTVNSGFTRVAARRYRRRADPIVLGLVDLVGDATDAAGAPADPPIVALRRPAHRRQAPRRAARRRSVARRASRSRASWPSSPDTGPETEDVRRADGRRASPTRCGSPAGSRRGELDALLAACRGAREPVGARGLRARRRRGGVARHAVGRRRRRGQRGGGARGRRRERLRRGIRRTRPCSGRRSSRRCRVARSSAVPRRRGSRASGSSAPWGARSSDIVDRWRAYQRRADRVRRRARRADAARVAAAVRSHENSAARARPASRHPLALDRLIEHPRIARRDRVGVGRVDVERRRRPRPRAARAGRRRSPGHPRAIASSGGRPNPSNRVGKTSAVDSAIQAIRARRGSAIRAGARASRRPEALDERRERVVAVAAGDVEHAVAASGRSARAPRAGSRTPCAASGCRPRAAARRDRARCGVRRRRGAGQRRRRRCAAVARRGTRRCRRASPG